MRNEEWRRKSLRDLFDFTFFLHSFHATSQSMEIRKDFFQNSSFLIPNS